ncbi:hypothetical protein [Streptomyces sp. RTd22]|uniref:hypothetical protein n=1 Tax=Streptomyces sp. RTd22 TaxID=1841249 RepID=UPI0007C5DB52|nr:hypothetical protein [Streptomyces sp. RTd22]
MKPEELEYLDAVRQTPLGRIEPYLSSVCRDCDGQVDSSNLAGHVMIGSHVVICCEGYFMVDPNVVGIPSPNWSDWREKAESNPKSLYKQGEFLAAHALELGVSYDSDLPASAFHPKLVGAAIAALRAWLEVNWGSAAVREAEKEALGHTGDGMYVGTVDKLNYQGKTLWVGDRVRCANQDAQGNDLSFSGVLAKIELEYWGSELKPTVNVRAPEATHDDPIGWEDLSRVTSS